MVFSIGAIPIGYSQQFLTISQGQEGVYSQAVQFPQNNPDGLKNPDGGAEKALTCNDEVKYVEAKDNGQPPVVIVLGAHNGFLNATQSFPAFTGQVTQVSFRAETYTGMAVPVQISIHALGSSNQPIGSPIGSVNVNVSSYSDYTAVFSSPVNVTNGFGIVIWHLSDSLDVYTNGNGSGQGANYATVESMNGVVHDVLDAGYDVDLWVKPTIRFSHPDPSVTITPASTCPNTQVQAVLNSNASSLAHYNHPVYKANNHIQSIAFGDGSAVQTGATESHAYSSAGTYTVTGTSVYSGWTNECTTTATQTITVMPDVYSFFSYEATGLSVQFTSMAVGATSHSWNFGDGGTAGSPNPIRNYASPGTYTVELTVNGSCGTDLYYRNITIAEGENSSDLGVEENSGMYVNIYPNPAQHLFVISYEIEKTGDIYADLFTLDGKKINSHMAFNTNTGDFSFDVSDLSAGVYILNMRISDRVITRKIVKE